MSGNHTFLHRRLNLLLGLWICSFLLASLGASEETQSWLVTTPTGFYTDTKTSDGVALRISTDAPGFSEESDQVASYLTRCQDDCEVRVAISEVIGPDLGFAGVQVRSGEGLQKPFVFLGSNSQGEMGIFYRREVGGELIVRKFSVGQIPAQISIKVKGSSAYLASSFDGLTWVSHGQINTDFSGHLFAGVSIFSGNDGEFSTAEFGSIVCRKPGLIHQDISRQDFSEPVAYQTPGAGRFHFFAQTPDGFTGTVDAALTRSSGSVKTQVDVFDLPGVSLPVLEMETVSPESVSVELSLDSQGQFAAVRGLFYNPPRWKLSENVQHRFQGDAEWLESGVVSGDREGALSDTEILYDGGVTWVADRGAGDSSVGLFSTASSTSYSVRFSQGVYHVQHSGSSGPGRSFESGDVFSIERVGGYIVFLHNGRHLITVEAAREPLSPYVGMLGSYAKVRSVSVFGASIPGDRDGDGIDDGVEQGLFSLLEVNSVFDVSSSDVKNSATVSSSTDNEKATVAASSPVAKASQSVDNWLAVTWENRVGTAVSEGIVGSNLQRSASSQGWGSSGAASYRRLVGEGKLQVVPGQIDAYRMIGFSADDVNADYRDIEYALYFAINGSLKIYEGGTYRGTFGTYAADDIFEIRRDSLGAISYWQNGTNFYTSTRSSAGEQLMVDTSFYTSNSRVTEVRWTGSVDLRDWRPVVWSYPQGVSSSEGSTGSAIQRTAGGNNWGSSGAVSLYRMPGAGAVQFQPGEVNTHRMIGLGVANASESYQDIEYAIFLATSSRLYIYEGGASRGGFGSYNADDVFEIRRAANGQVSYWRNGLLFYTSTRSSAGETLLVDASLYTGGSQITEVRWCGVDDWIPVEWQQVIGATSSLGSKGSDLQRSASGNNWGGSGAISMRAMPGAGELQVVPGATNAYRMIGLGVSNDSADYRDIEYALYFSINGGLKIYESGVYRGTFGSYTATDVFEVRRDDAGEVTYWKNDAKFFTSPRLSSAENLFVDTSFYTAASKVTEVRWRGQTALFENDGDLDDDNIPDEFEESLFAAMGVTSIYDINPGDDFDNDGVSNYQEYLDGTSLIDSADFRDWVPVDWQSIVGASPSAGSVGSNLQRSASGSSWGASGAVSQRYLPGAGSLRVIPAETNTYRMIGLGVSNDSADYRDIEYALFFAINGGLRIYESGSYRGAFGSYSADDVFEVRRDDAGLVTYWKNGAKFYTSTRSSAGETLIVDTSLYSANSQVTEVRWSGAVLPPERDWVPVDWEALVGSVSSTGVDGTNLQRTAGGSSWGASGAVSQRYLPAEGVLQVIPGETSTYRMIGFGVGNDSADYRDIEYALFFAINGSLRIYENGTYRGAFGSYTAGDVFEIHRDADGEVSYWKNNGKIYTSTRSSAGERLIVDTSLYTSSSKVTEVRWEGAVMPEIDWVPVEWQSLIGVTASSGSEGTNLQRSAAGSGWGGSGAISKRFMAGEGRLQVIPAETNTYRMIGLGVSNDSADYRDIEYALYFAINGVLRVYESGAHRGAFGSYSSGDVFEIRRDSAGRVTYQKNGVIFYTSARSSAGEKLFVDTSFYSANSRVSEVRWAGADYDWSPVEWTAVSESVATAGTDGSNLQSTAASSGWDISGAISARHMPGAGGLQVIPGQSDAFRLVGLSVRGAAPTHEGIDYGLFFRDDATLQIYEGNTLKGSFGTYTADDVFEICRTTDGQLSYWKNGTKFYTSDRASIDESLMVDASFYTAGSRLTELRWHGSDYDWTPVAWQDLVGAVASDGVDGTDLRRTAGGSSWGASGAISQRIMPGEGALRVIPGATNTYRMIGLGVDNSNNSYTDIEYALFFAINGALRIYESGSYRGAFGTYSSSDVFEIRRDAEGQVTYWRNGILFYTSARSSAGEELIVDTSLYTASSAVTEVRWRGVRFPGPVDSDGDGLTDDLEAQFGTNPNNPDSDDDGIGDFVEYEASLIDPGLDTDGDGISDQVERLLGTNSESSEFADDETRIDGFSTRLRVFTPVAL